MFLFSNEPSEPPTSGWSNGNPNSPIIFKLNSCSQATGCYWSDAGYCNGDWLIQIAVVLRQPKKGYGKPRFIRVDNS